MARKHRKPVMRDWWVWHQYDGSDHQVVACALPYTDDKLSSVGFAKLRDVHAWMWSETERISAVMAGHVTPRLVGTRHSSAMIVATFKANARYQTAWDIPSIWNGPKPLYMTPPIVKFASIVDAHEEDRTELWFQREMFDLTGAVFVGRPDHGRDLRSVMLTDESIRNFYIGTSTSLRWTHDVIGQSQVALDALLETGEPDSRYL